MVDAITKHTPNSCIIWKSGSTYYALNSDTGAVTSNAAFHTLHNGLTANNTTIRLSPGTFTQTGPLYLTSNNLTLEGSGPSTILSGGFAVATHKHITGGILDCAMIVVGRDADSNAYFAADHVQNPVIKNLTIDCNGSIGDHLEGVRFSHCDHGIIKYCKVMDSSDSGVVIDDYEADIIVKGCEITGSGIGNSSTANGIGLGGARYIKILDNFVYTNGHTDYLGSGHKGSGIEVDSSLNPPNNNYFIIKGNHFYNNWDSGLYLYGLGKSIISDNYCYYNYNHGIDLEDGDSNNHYNQNLTIANNILDGNLHGHGIKAELVSNILIAGNKIINNNLWGIQIGSITTCDNMKIDPSNEISGNGSGGVTVVAGTNIYSRKIPLTLVTTTAMDVAAAWFYPIGGDVVGSATIESKRQMFNSPGYIKNMRFTVSQSPDNGAGTQTWTIVLQKAGVDQTVTGVISEAATSITDVAHTDYFAAGDRLNWKITPAATPKATTYANVCADLYILDW